MNHGGRGEHGGRNAGVAALTKHGGRADHRAGGPMEFSRSASATGIWCQREIRAGRCGRTCVDSDLRLFRPFGAGPVWGPCPVADATG